MKIISKITIIFTLVIIIFLTYFSSVGIETDQFNNGKYMSHFEMYLSSMNEIGAITKVINDFIKILEKNENLNDCILKSQIPNFAKDFMVHTFDIINSNKTHVIAAAFTFGREDLIPDIFIEILCELRKLYTEAQNLEVV